MPSHETDNERALTALLAYIDRERQRRRTAILEAAEQEARALVRSGRRESRRRVHEVVEHQRRERHSRLRSADATEQARIREREHAIVRERLDRAWRSLGEQLERRWRKADDRRQWLQALLQSAARHLPGGDWQLEHAGECGTRELERALKALREQRTDVQIHCASVEDMSPGLRIRAGSATLDATRAALMGRRAHVEGLLLGALGARPGLVRGDVQTGDEP